MTNFLQPWEIEERESHRKLYSEYTVENHKNLVEMANLLQADKRELPAGLMKELLDYRLVQTDLENWTKRDKYYKMVDEYLRDPLSISAFNTQFLNEYNSSLETIEKATLRPDGYYNNKIESSKEEEYKISDFGIILANIYEYCFASGSTLETDMYFDELMARSGDLFSRDIKISKEDQWAFFMSQSDSEDAIGEISDYNFWKAIQRLSIELEEIFEKKFHPHLENENLKDNSKTDEL
jgi:hypothetical protein